MRATVPVLMALLLAGCAHAEPPALAPTGPSTPALPLASELTWRQWQQEGVRLALPPGPSTAAVLLDLPPEAWTKSRLNDGPVSSGWFVSVAASVEGLDAWNETGPQPQVAVMMFRVEGDSVTLGSRFNPNAPIQDGDEPWWQQDVSACSPDPMRLLVVLIADGLIAPGVGVNVTLFSGGFEATPPPGPVDARPDIVGPAGLVASYEQMGAETVARGWEVEDGRTTVPLPVQPFGASVGAVSARVPTQTAPPGLYGFWFTRTALGSEASVWDVSTEVDGETRSTSYPVTGALVSLMWIHGLGPVASEWALATRLQGAAPEPALLSLTALRAPLDLAGLGLRVEAQETMARWHEVYPAVTVDPALCL